jgi:hypothetical protein
MLQQVSATLAIIVAFIQGYCSSQLLQHAVLGLEKTLGPSTLNKQDQAMDRPTVETGQKRTQAG